MNETTPKSSITFIKQGKEQGKENAPVADGGVPDNQVKGPKESVKKMLSVKNVNFLFGAGVSSPAIPVMSCLQEKFEKAIESDADKKAKYQQIKEEVERRLEKGGLKNNALEDIMGILYSIEDAVCAIPGCEGKGYVLLGKEIKEFIIGEVCDPKDESVLETYKNFYLKVAKRSQDLSRINVFTTNYDLFNERALDALNIDYINGFGGGLKRYFNPARFHYAFSKKVDPEIDKFEPIQSMVYLYKVHGSVNWIQPKENDGEQLFDLEEVTLCPCHEKNDGVMIYPTPQKSGMALNSPYSDLMAEMKSKLLLPNSVLFVIGYSFSDFHVNNIIYQALSVNSSLSIFIFGKEKGALPDGDSRFYQFYGKDGKSEQPCHYFDYIVENLLPEPEDNEDQIVLKNFVKSIKKFYGRKQQ